MYGLPVIGIVQISATPGVSIDVWIITGSQSDLYMASGGLHKYNQQKCDPHEANFNLR